MREIGQRQQAEKKKSEHENEKEYILAVISDCVFVLQVIDFSHGD